MPQHGRRSAGAEYEDEPVRRLGGFLTMETALVLALIALIAVGSVLVHAALPSKRETQTVVGDKKVRITTVGKGGVLPGPVEERTLPVAVATPVPVAAPPKTPKPRKTATPAAGVPTPTPTPKGGSIGGGGTGTGGGGGQCTVLILCKPGQKPPPSPTPAPAPATNPAQPPVGGTVDQPPAGQTIAP
jgi:hypothetical protein